MPKSESSRTSAKPFDRSKRPHRVYRPHHKRPIALSGMSLDFTVVPSAPLSGKEIRNIVSEVPNLRYSEALHDNVQYLAATFLRWRTQKTPSRMETKYQLKLLSHLAWSRYSSPDRVDLIDSQLDQTMASLNEDALFIMCAARRQLPVTGQSLGLADIRSEQRDWGIIGAAATFATNKGWTGGRGDYADRDVITIVELLVELYEKTTHKRATCVFPQTTQVEKKSLNPHVSTSPCSKFLIGFFDHVIPEVDGVKRKISPSSASSRLKNYLRHRNRVTIRPALTC